MQIVRVKIPGTSSIEVRGKLVQEVWDAIAEQFSVKDFSWDKIKRGRKKKVSSDPAQV